LNGNRKRGDGMEVVGFDEQLYLSKNPDVKAAIERGEFESGLAHYLAFGREEMRLGAPTLSDEAESDPTIPPRRLRLRVHGSEDVERFQSVGKELAVNILDVVKQRVVLSDQSNVLDFGCGCGRVIKDFRELSPGSLFGTDIDGEAIDWCQKNLASIASFFVNDDFPPLPFTDRKFDLIYSISIFTHLPEDMQFAWLAELERVLVAGGWAILTVHGASLFPREQLEQAVTREFDEKGFDYNIGAGTEGLPKYYQTAFHSKNYIYEHWNRILIVDEIIERGAGRVQDIIVCRKR
jgi:SAM-dependent methyltransferase